MNPSHRILAACLLASCILAAPSPAAPVRAVPPLTFEPTTFKADSGATIEAETGTLSVPESRSAAAGRTLALKLVRFRSTAKHPGAPIVYLAGGPGGSGIDTARGSRFPLFLALREFADVIALDQRGTGASEPSLRCTEPVLLPFDRPLDRAEAEGLLAATMKKCFDRLRQGGIDPAAYTTQASADDLDDLRRALGVPKISLWGISYGTHLALATLRAHGDHVERAILAGVEPLDHTLKLPSDQQELLRAIAEQVRRDPAVSRAVPDLLGSIARLLERLTREPATVTLVHPMAPQPFPVRVGPLDLQLVLAQMLEGPQTFAALPDLVYRLEQADWTALALQAGALRAARTPSAMSVAMDCASGASPAYLDKVRAEVPGTLLGDAINLPFFGICQGLGVPDLGEGFRGPLRSAVPVLLISGTLDGRTPPRNAEGVMQGLARAQHLVIEGAGHSDPLFLSSPKILDAMRAFLRGKAIPARRIVIDPVRFTPPRKVAELPDEKLARYAGTYRIQGDDVRRVFLAGSLLYSQRGRNPPLPLRPVSETEFFWEGMPGALRFEITAEGKVTALLADSDGSGRKWERSEKVE